MIETIPVDELIQDRCESIADVEICRVALAQGITHHRDGMPVRYRLERNQQIVRLIDAELVRRAEAIAPCGF